MVNVYDASEMVHVLQILWLLETLLASRSPLFGLGRAGKERRDRPTAFSKY
jgi:hypothetical protein